MHRIRHALTQAWLVRGPTALALWPIAVLFTLLVRARQELYRRGIFKPDRLPVPVWVVGNVLVGGVGKTPVVMALVQHLTQRGLRVGVLSRGYGRLSQDVRQVRPNSPAEEVGDEPLLMARTCGVPVWVGADRVAAGQALLRQHPEVQWLICDDGMQHLRLARDLELCVFDERVLGNGWLLPAGPLREPWPRPNDPAVTRFELAHGPSTGLATYTFNKCLADVAVSAQGTEHPLPLGIDTPVMALAGIAKPDVFFSMLRTKGVILSQTLSLADHADMQDLTLDPRHGLVLCTEKDAVKLWPRYPEVLAVPLITELPQDLLDALDACVAAKLSSDDGL